MPWSRRSGFRRGPVAHEHDLARHASVPKPRLRAPGFGQRESSRDQRLDLPLIKEIEQGAQILSKPGRLQPLEPLDAVGDHPSPAREEPAASDVQPEARDGTKATTTPRTA